MNKIVKFTAIAVLGLSAGAAITLAVTNRNADTQHVATIDDSFINNKENTKFALDYIETQPTTSKVTKEQWLKAFSNLDNFTKKSTLNMLIDNQSFHMSSTDYIDYTKYHIIDVSSQYYLFEENGKTYEYNEKDGKKETPKNRYDFHFSHAKGYLTDIIYNYDKFTFDEEKQEYTAKCYDAKYVNLAETVDDAVVKIENGKVTYVKFNSKFKNNKESALTYEFTDFGTTKVVIPDVI